MSEILAQRLWIGSREEAMSLPWLQAHRITLIINMAVEIPSYHQDKIRTWHLPLYDAERECIHRFLSLIADAIYHEMWIRNGRVLVHCAAGISRSVSGVMAYLIQHHHSTTDHALRVIREKRPQANPNPGFMQQLRQFETDIGQFRRLWVTTTPSH